MAGRPVFYFILKALFALEIFKFWLWPVPLAPVTTNINIKVPVDLKRLLSGHTGTIIFT